MSLGSDVTLKWTVFPISATVYSNPKGGLIGARCSSPVTGFRIGSIADSPTAGIRTVALRFGRSISRLMGAKTGSSVVGQTAEKISK